MTIRVMMTKNDLDRYSLFLFNHENKCKFEMPNPLKEFMSFLKSNGSSGVIDFSFTSGLSSLHPTKSLKDNFILDSIPSSLIKNNDDNFEALIKTIKNETLVELVNSLKPFDKVPELYSEKEISIASMVKSLLSKSRYIFIDDTQLKLDHDALEIIKNCLQIEMNNHNRKIFISTNRATSWLSITSAIVTNTNGRFNLKDIREKENIYQQRHLDLVKAS